MIPDIDAAASRDAVGDLYGRVAHDDVLPDRVVGRAREHHDAVRVANRSVSLDQVVIGRALNADAEIGRRPCCVAVSARLVPPERVIASDNSYAAACRG